MKGRIAKYICLIALINFSWLVIAISYFTFYFEYNNYDYEVYITYRNIIYAFAIILIDFNFLLLWFGIYSSTEVCLLLNKLMKNS